MLEVLPFTLPSDVANALYTAGKGWSSREAHKGPAGPLGFVVFQWLWGPWSSIYSGHTPANALY